MNPESTKKESKVQRVLQALGPGVTTGAADDDPSGVTTYSIVGAQFGTSFLWTAWITWPLMAGVQMMCARVGMVTGIALGETFGSCAWPGLGTCARSNASASPARWSTCANPPCFPAHSGCRRNR